MRLKENLLHNSCACYLVTVMRTCEREFVALALVKSKYLVLFWHETKTKLSGRQSETDWVPMFKLYERILGYVQAWYSRIRTARKQVRDDITQLCWWRISSTGLHAIHSLKFLNIFLGNGGGRRIIIARKDLDDSIEKYLYKSGLEEWEWYLLTSYRQTNTLQTAQSMKSLSRVSNRNTSEAINPLTIIKLTNQSSHETVLIILSAFLTSLCNISDCLDPFFRFRVSFTVYKPSLGYNHSHSLRKLYNEWNCAGLCIRSSCL